MKKYLVLIRLGRDEDAEVSALTLIHYNTDNATAREVLVKFWDIIKEFKGQNTSFGCLEHGKIYGEFCSQCGKKGEPILDSKDLVAIVHDFFRAKVDGTSEIDKFLRIRGFDLFGSKENIEAIISISGASDILNDKWYDEYGQIYNTGKKDIS